MVGYDIFRDDMRIEEQLNITSYRDGTLEPLTTYRYQVVAVDDDGNYSPPAEITITTSDINDIGKPTAPANIQFERVLVHDRR